MQNHRYYINRKKDCAFYFYYNEKSFTFLDLNFLRTINHNAKQYVIYADYCLLSNNFLKKRHITFKKINRIKISLSADLNS